LVADMAMIMTVMAMTLAGIYPAGHFDSSHKLTVKNFYGIVKKEVDAGKTLFVRWIASEG